jgi:hypothetical protein
VNNERREIKRLFNQLCNEIKRSFPKHHQSVKASSKHGVYIIRKGNIILHVGRTLRREGGLNGRLRDHLHGSSSFTDKYLKGNEAILREDGYTFQFLEVEDPRKRALLESYTIGTLCPKHIGLGD